MPLYILTHNVELTTLIHKIIVSIVASAHELRNDHIKVFQSVGTTLLNSSILSRLGLTLQLWEFSTYYKKGHKSKAKIAELLYGYTMGLHVYPESYVWEKVMYFIQSTLPQ